MTERLPTPGDDFDAWGAILNGFLGVSHNDDGTEKLPGGSYLIATASIPTAASGDDVTLSWIAGDSAGSDLAVNGGDSTLIDFLTSGWYVVALKFQINVVNGGDSISDSTVFFGAKDLNSPSWERAVAGATPTVDAFTAPPEVWTAGMQLNADAFVEVAGGHGDTWTAIFELHVVRLA